MYSNFNKHTLVNEIRQNPVVLETIIYPVNNKKSSWTRLLEIMYVVVAGSVDLKKKYGEF